MIYIKIILCYILFLFNFFFFYVNFYYKVSGYETNSGILLCIYFFVKVQKLNMPQLVPFYFVNQVTFAFILLIIIIYVFSKYILPRFVRLFISRIFISKL